MLYKRMLDVTLHYKLLHSSLKVVWACSDISDKQRRLAEITEMIHTASLVHDDVLDECDTRRGTPRSCNLKPISEWSLAKKSNLNYE